MVESLKSKESQIMAVFVNMKSENENNNSTSQWFECYGFKSLKDKNHWTCY